MKQKTTFLKFGNTYLNQLTLILMLFISGVSFSQVAGVSFPDGGFNIDGDLDSDASTGDWLGTRSNSYVFDIYPAFPFGDALRASPVTAVSTFRVIDAYDGNDDIFQGGGKYTDDPSTWKVNPNGKSGGKGDINNVLLHVGQDNNGDQWVIVASDRLVTTGTSYLDFEFLQKPLTYNNNTTGFITQGVDGGRTVGDILISVSYTNGGSLATVRYYEWEVDATSALGYNYIENTSTLPTRFGAGNIGTVSTNIGAFGVNQYTANQFVEAAINISAFFNTGDPCDGLTIGTILVKTKSSDADTAALDDVVAPIPVRLNLGTAEIDYADADFCSPSASVNLLGVTGGTFSASPSGLTINSSTGEIDVANSTPGTYTVTYSFTTGTCPKSVNTTVVIPETSPTPTTINQDFCKNTGIKNYNVTATPGYTLNYYASNDPAASPLATVPTVDTDSAPAGLYTVYVSQNKAGSCESDRVPVSIQVASALVVSENKTNVACFEDSNGAIDLSVSGGSGAYVFEWKDSSNTVIAATEDLSGLEAGSYTVTITSGSCVFTETYNITEPVAVTVAASATNVSCNGAADGTITVSGLSAGASYTITLNGGDGTDLSGQSAFAPGTYTITASASNGNGNGICEATASVTITEPVAVTVAASSTNVSCNGAADGT
ncbi:SprB repeat-containing protein, partial [Leeuwenhoekiella parthenopeia]